MSMEERLNQPPYDATEDFESMYKYMSAQGGRIGAQKGGIMPLLNLGGMEKDYRQDGGFVPIGRKEKADDVPARLSKNEFVFTADAVRAAGGGDIDRRCTTHVQRHEKFRSGRRNLATVTRTRIMRQGFQTGTFPTNPQQWVQPYGQGLASLASSTTWTDLLI